MTMTSHRPYIIRALNEWILENNCTPYLLVNAYENGVQVPQEFVKDGQIVLNISPRAIKGLLVTNEGIEFDGRFGGIPTRVYVPVKAVLGIYAKENGQGMIFEADDLLPEPPQPSAPSNSGNSGKGSKAGKGPGRKPPSLRIVK